LPTVASPASEQAQAVIAFKDDYIAGKNAEFAEIAAKARQFVLFMTALGVVALLCFAYLAFAAGRKNADKVIHLNFIDRLYSEFTLAFIFLALLFSVGLMKQFTYYLYDERLFVAISVVCAGGTAVMLVFCLSLIRRLKDKSLLRHTLIYTVFSRIFRFIHRIYAGGSLMHKAVIAVLLLGIATMIPFVGVVTVPLAVWVVFRKVNMYNRLQEGVFAIQGGNYAGDIESESLGEFKALTESVNSIKNGLNDEVERRLRAERLRTELISNVSHDIRTPLTSVITYVDLLKSEPTDNENIKKYIEVIDQKAARLKTLTDDLFEASKASSGNIPVTLAKVDLVSLLTQGLGELDDKIKSSGLDFRVQASEGQVYALADGPLLWRVVENMLSNVFKYSLPGSRVYVSVLDNGNSAGIEVKNISESPLNMPENELMERFKRGDESRSGQGSGLGLAIARSLMLAQGGRFDIKIDGDLFKAVLTVPKWMEQ
jgi:signal transduction histidine kinase